MRRKGLMKGKGRGYKNVIGKDPYVHSQSARGIKQPQRINPLVTKGKWNVSRTFGSDIPIGKIRFEPFYFDENDKLIKGERYGEIMSREEADKFALKKGYLQPFESTKQFKKLNSFKDTFRPKMVELTGDFLDKYDVRTKSIWIDESDFEKYSPQQLRNKYNFISVNKADYVDRLTKKKIKQIVKPNKKVILMAYKNWIKDNKVKAKKNRNILISELNKKGMDIFKAIDFIDNL